jgi:hypothetical protein
LLLERKERAIEKVSILFFLCTKKKAQTLITTSPHVASQPSHVTDLSCLAFRFLVPAVPLAGWLDQ